MISRITVTIFSRPVSRILPVLICIGMIFYLSGTPSRVLVNGSRALVRQSPEAVFLKYGKIHVTINLLKSGHVVGYAFLGTVLTYSLAHFVRRPALWAVVIAALFAVSDEFHQNFTPGRHSSWQDVVLDVGAAGLAILLVIFIQKWKKKMQPASKPVI